jgi:hypothetical protein
MEFTEGCSADTRCQRRRGSGDYRLLLQARMCRRALALSSSLRPSISVTQSLLARLLLASVQPSPFSAMEQQHQHQHLLIRDPRPHMLERPSR